MNVNRRGAKYLGDKLVYVRSQGSQQAKLPPAGLIGLGSQGPNYPSCPQLTMGVAACL